MLELRMIKSIISKLCAGKPNAPNLRTGGLDAMGLRKLELGILDLRTSGLNDSAFYTLTLDIREPSNLKVDALELCTPSRMSRNFVRQSWVSRHFIR